MDGRLSMAPKLQKRAENTRNRILTAAVEAFSVSGFAGTTVEDVAGRAGVNKQRIYAYFGSKRKLFEAALLEVFSQVKIFSESAVRRAEAEPEKLSRIVLEEFFRVHQEQPALWRLLAWANLQGAESAAALAGVRREENSALRKIFESAQQKQLINPVKFENWLYTLLAVSCFYHSNFHTMQYTHDPAMGSAMWVQSLLDDTGALFTRK